MARPLVPQTTFASEAVIRINLPILLFSVAVALGTGVLFGLWPALQLSRTHIGEIMQSGAGETKQIDCYQSRQNSG